MQYSMTCTCGHVMSTEADNREAAVSKMKATMTEEAVAQHMAEKHPGEPAISQQQVHTMIEQGLTPAS